jgi:hypothetical protein
MRNCESREEVDRVQRYMAGHPGVDVEEAKVMVLGRKAPRVPGENEIGPRERAAILMFADAIGLDPEGQWLEIRRQYAVAMDDPTHRHHQVAKSAASAVGGGGGARLDAPTPGGIKWPPHDLYYGSTEPFPDEQNVTTYPEPFTTRVPG